MNKFFVLGTILFLGLFIFTACSGQEPEPESVVIEQENGREAATVELAATEAGQPKPTEKQPDATEIPATPTQEVDPARPEETPSPTAVPTDIPTVTPVPDEWLTPAPHAPDVQQPPYVESECSDRFPCNDDAEAWEARIRVPDGFKASYFAQIPNREHPERAALLTSLTFGPDGRLYVAETQGNIYAIDPAGAVELFFEGLTVPTGLAFQPGTEKLFVSSRVLDRNVDGEGKVSVIENGVETVLFAGVPCCYVAMHGPQGIDFGPDGYGYVGVGGRADHGEVLDGSNTQDELHPWEATILRFSPDGSEIEPYAYGFRNPYDISWDAQGQLWATDNGRDGEVPDELHLVVPGEQHGYPYYDCPACFGIPDDVDLVETFYEFEPHSVATGIVTYLDNEFPGYYNSQFIPLWTAMDFAERVMRFSPDGQSSTFATGFAAPIDVTVGPDGNLYVADYATGIIFKIEYAG